MARVPYLDQSDLPEEHRWLFDRLAAAPGSTPGNIFRTLAHNPGVLHQYMRLGSYLRGHTTLNPRLRELAILLVGHLSDCQYEYIHHVAIARRARVPARQIDQLPNWRASAAFNDHERAVLAFTETLTIDATVPDALFQPLKDFLSDQELVELSLNVAFYAMTVRFLNALQVELETPPGRETTG